MKTLLLLRLCVSFEYRRLLQNTPASFLLFLSMLKLQCKRHYRNLATYSWCTTWREHFTKTAPARRRHSVGGGGGAQLYCVLDSYSTTNEKDAISPWNEPHRTKWVKCRSCRSPSLEMDQWAKPERVYLKDNRNRIKLVRAVIDFRERRFHMEALSCLCVSYLFEYGDEADTKKKETRDTKHTFTHLYFRVGRGLDPSMDWLHWIGSGKMDPCPTLIYFHEKLWFCSTLTSYTNLLHFGESEEPR